MGPDWYGEYPLCEDGNLTGNEDDEKPYPGEPTNDGMVILNNFNGTFDCLDCSLLEYREDYPADDLEDLKDHLDEHWIKYQDVPNSIINTIDEALLAKTFSDTNEELFINRELK
jgi:hypothetical protein